MPSRAEIVTFNDSPPPPGADPWVPGAAPSTGIEVTEADPAWPRQYDDLTGRIRQALGWRVLQLEHVGSTSVPGLAAKPIIDIDLTVADPRPAFVSVIAEELTDAVDEPSDDGGIDGGRPAADPVEGPLVEARIEPAHCQSERIL